MCKLKLKPPNRFGCKRIMISYSLSGINRNEGTLYVGNMIPGVTFESIKDNPMAAYNNAVKELVNERVSSKSDFMLFYSTHKRRVC